MSIILAVLLILLVLLLLPIKYSVDIYYSEILVYRIAAVYARGLLSFLLKGNTGVKEMRLKILGIAIDGGGGKKEGEVTPDSGKRTSRLLKKKHFYSRMVKAGWEIVHRILPGGAHVSLKFGLGDPLYTGMAAGVISTISPCLKERFMFRPVFSEEVMVDFSAKGVIIPIVPLGIALKHLLIFTREEFNKKLSSGGCKDGSEG